MMQNNHVNSHAGRLEKWLGALLSSCLIVSATAVGAASYEPDTVRFQAAKLVDKELLKGPNHTLRGEVVNKDYMNHYKFDSPFGEFAVTGDRGVPHMAHEIDAIAELQQMSKTEVLAKSAAEAAQKPVMAAKQLAENPAETVKGIPAGVGRLFARTTDIVEDVAEKTSQAASGEGGDGGSTTDTAVEAGTDLAKSYLGVGSAHRKLARDLEVDPYSTNKLLQAELGSMANYAAAGSFGTKLIMPSIPGANIVTNVKDLVWNLSARDLKIRNEKSLIEMGADEALVAKFLENPNYTPTDQTRVVTGLESLTGAADRVIAVEKAAAARTRQEALLYSRLMEIYAGYHKSRAPITAIAETDRLLPLAVTKSGARVLAVPVDYVSWTRRTADSMAALGKLPGVKGKDGKKELWVQGSISDRARKELGTLGWTVFDQAFVRLEKDMKK